MSGSRSNPPNASPPDQVEMQTSHGRGRSASDYLAPKLWWVLVVVLGLLVAVDYGLILSITNNHDFEVYYQAAVDLRGGRDIYADVVPFKQAIDSGTFNYKAEDTIWPYAYPPVLAMLLLPLSYLPYDVASWIWTGLNVLALLLGCWLVLRAMGNVTPARIALGLLLLYGFKPAQIGLRLGQIDLLVFLAIATVFYLLRRGREGWASVLLGLAVAIKFFSGVLIAYLLWKRCWRPAILAAAVAVILVVGSFAAVGFERVPPYLEFTSLYSRGGFVAYPYHMCFNAFFTRALKENLFAEPIMGAGVPWLADALTLISSGVVVAASAWATWGGGHTQGRRFALEYGLVVTAVLLVVPPSPLYSYTWLLVPFTILAVDIGEAETPSLWWALATAAAYLVVARELPYNMRYVIRFLQSHYLWGGLMLWSLLLFRLRQPSIRAASVAQGGAESGSRDMSGG